MNDVVSIDDRDYVCEGTINYDEDGQRWVCARCVDHPEVKWLVVGLDRGGTRSTRVLVEDREAHVAGYPPEVIAAGEVQYELDKRGTATCTVRGDVGSLGHPSKDRPVGHVERCRWWLYRAPGDATLLIEQWGADYRTLRGYRVADSAIDLMQAS